MLASTYWPAWKAAVQEGKARGVMCSYNALNGVPTCLDARLNRVLRSSWGFDGYEGLRNARAVATEKPGLTE